MYRHHIVFKIRNKMTDETNLRWPHADKCVFEWTFNMTCMYESYVSTAVHGWYRCFHCCCPGWCCCVLARLRPGWASGLWVKSFLLLLLQTTTVLLAWLGNCLGIRSFPPESQTSKMQFRLNLCPTFTMRKNWNA